MAYVVRSNVTINGTPYYRGETLPEEDVDQSGRGLRRVRNRGDLDILPNPVVEITDFELDASTRNDLYQLLREHSWVIAEYLPEMSYDELDHAYRMEYNQRHRPSVLEAIQDELGQTSKIDDLKGFLEQSVQDIRGEVEDIEDLDLLERLYQKEQSSENPRSTAIKALQDRLKDLSDEGESEEDASGEASEE